MSRDFESNKARYCGIIPPIITPINEDETLDEESLEKLINHCIDGGVHGIFAMGTSGEAMCVSRGVWKRTIQATLRIVNDRVPVFCGAIDSSTIRVIESIKELEQEGCKNVVVTPAFYIRNSCQSEIIRHYEKICGSTSLKVVAYNIPPTTNANIFPETMLEISKIDNVVAYKDSCADWEQFQRNLFLLKNSKISLFNGAEELCGASMIFGAQGCVPGLANFFPELFVNMYEAAINKDIEKVYDLQRKVWAVRKTLSVGKSWVSAMKYIASKMGFGSGIASNPIEPLTPDEKKRIDKILGYPAGILPFSKRR